MLKSRLLIFAAAIASLCLVSQASAFSFSSFGRSFSKPRTPIVRPQLPDYLQTQTLKGPRIKTPFGPLCGPVQFPSKKTTPDYLRPKPNKPIADYQIPIIKLIEKIKNDPSRQLSPKQCAPKTKVPDGGLTFAMLGSALAGLAVIKRKKKAA